MHWVDDDDQGKSIQVIHSEDENVKLMMKNFHLKNLASNKELMSSVMKDETPR